MENLPDIAPPLFDVQLDELPDELLLEVLSFLPAEDLLSARAVCRRLARLAVWPRLWSHRSVILEGAGAGAGAAQPDWRLVSRVLRVAPRLEWLDVCPPRGEGDLHPRQVPAPVLRDLSATGCAVRRLSVEVTSGSASAIADALYLQRRLGRLRAVDVHFYDMMSGEQMVEVLRELKGCDLTELGINSCLGVPLPALNIAWSWPLRVLIYYEHSSHLADVLDGDDLLLEQLLTRHAGSLETVGICGGFPRVAPLLRQCANLRHVTVPAEEGLAALLQCPKLTDLKLIVTGAIPDDVIVYLTCVTSLRRLEIFPYKGATGVDPPWQHVLAALSFTGQSELEALVLHHLHDECYDLAPLSAALGGLPRLSSLSISNAPYPEFLRSVAAPGLELLHFLEWASICDRAPCSQAAALCDLLGRSPRLRLAGLAEREGPYPCYGCRRAQGLPAD